MSDPGKIVVAVVAIVAVASTVRVIVGAAFQGRRSVANANSLEPVADMRLSRLEQAVDAIAVEIERVSEGQRFTTKLLSEQARQPEKSGRQFSANTPT